jgi:AGZA family xanthine/uracil permease-like MFS transporter
VVIAQPATLVQLGQLAQPPALYTVVGLLLTLILISARVPAAIFWGVVGTTGLGIALRQIALPTSLAAWPSLDLPGFQIDLWGALAPRYWPLLLVLVFFDLFDKLGTLLGVAHEGGFLVDGKLPRAGRALVADSSATVAGALLGTSPVTSFIESGSGVAIGARTGLANLVTAACFLVALCFAPLVGAVAGFPPATAPALITVGVLMTKAVAEIDWSDLTEALPAFFTMLLIPLTFSISHGLAIGVIVYAVVKTAAGRGREVHWLIYALAAAFALQYALLPVSA